MALVSALTDDKSLVLNYLYATFTDMNILVCIYLKCPNAMLLQ